MAKNYEGSHDGSRQRIAIIYTRWNPEIVGTLRDRCLARLGELNVTSDRIDQVLVPGAYEIPLAAKSLADTQKYDAIIALGCVIRGETAHFDFVAGEAVRGITNVSLESGMPVVFGILTTENRAQADHRASPDGLDKGKEFAEVAVEMANLRTAIRKDDHSWQRPNL